MNRRLIVSILLSVAIHSLLLFAKLFPVHFKEQPQVEKTVTLSFSEPATGKAETPINKRHTIKRTTAKKPAKKPKKHRPEKPGKPATSRKKAVSPPRRPRQPTRREEKRPEPEQFTQTESSPAAKKNPELEQKEFKPPPRTEEKKKPETPKADRKKKPETEQQKRKEFNRKKYISLLLAEIEENKFYPLIARRMGIEGRVKVRITLERSGKLKEVKVICSSGNKILDRAAVKLMRKCHFPPLPPEYEKEEFTVEIPVRYTLK